MRRQDHSEDCLPNISVTIRATHDSYGSQRRRNASKATGDRETCRSDRLDVCY